MTQTKTGSIWRDHERYGLFTEIVRCGDTSRHMSFWKRSGWQIVALVAICALGIAWIPPLIMEFCFRNGEWKNESWTLFLVGYGIVLTWPITLGIVIMIALLGLYIVFRGLTRMLLRSK